MADYKTYIFVWGALLIFTAITVWVSTIPLGVMNATVALIIASLKAGMVAFYFMHLRHEAKLVVAFAVFPLLVLALILFGTLTDVLTR